MNDRPFAERTRLRARRYTPQPEPREETERTHQADFVSAELLSHEGQPVVSLRLTPEGREKINHVVSLNEQAASLEDYVGLLRCDNGTLTTRLTMVLNPVPGYEIWLNHLPQREAIEVVKLIGGENAS